MNPFGTAQAKEEFIDVKGTADRLVMLECQKCGTIINEGKYNAKRKILSWACECGTISVQEDFEF